MWRDHLRDRDRHADRLDSGEKRKCESIARRLSGSFYEYGGRGLCTYTSTSVHCMFCTVCIVGIRGINGIVNLWSTCVVCGGGVILASDNNSDREGDRRGVSALGFNCCGSMDVDYLMAVISDVVMWHIGICPGPVADSALSEVVKRSPEMCVKH